MSECKEDHIKAIIELARYLLAQDDVEVVFTTSITEQALSITHKQGIYVSGNFSNTTVINNKA